jgi:hypothetical protein
MFFPGRYFDGENSSIQSNAYAQFSEETGFNLGTYEGPESYYKFHEPDNKIPNRVHDVYILFKRVKHLSFLLEEIDRNIADREIHVSNLHIVFESSEPHLLQENC